MGLRIKGTLNEAEVNSNKELMVSLAKDKANAGFSLLGAEINPEGQGAGRLVRRAMIGAEGTLQTGNDFMLFSDNFFGSILNTSKYKVVNTTMTALIASGRLALNAGNSVATSVATQVLTYKTFPLYLSSALVFDLEAMITQDVMPQNTIEFGLGLCTGIVTPTDGVFFRLNSSGVLHGVLNNNGSELVINLNYTPLSLQINRYTIKAYADSVEFWINGILYGTQSRGTSTGHPFASVALPIMLRMINNNALAVAQRFEVQSVNISLFGTNITRLWSSAMAGMGLSSINQPDGAVSGQSANYVNSTAPVSAVLANITAGYATLGGQFQFVAVAGAETDYALFGYQVLGRNLLVRGLRIETFNMGAIVATSPTLLQWALGVGSTGVSLATADSSTGGTRLPRRLPLGVQMLPVGSVIGQVAVPIDINLDAPVIVEAGTFLHVILKMPVGTATASQIIRGTVMINGFYE